MSKARIALSVLVLSLSLVVTGFMGATVFANDSSSPLAFGGLPHSDAPEKERPTSEDEQLETVSFEGNCAEITDPVVVEKVNPRYPPEAKEEKVMGIVTVKTVITEEGWVDDIEVVRSDDERFSKSAIDAIKQWRFDPALCDGTPVSVYYNLTVRFRLE